MEFELPEKPLRRQSKNQTPQGQADNVVAPSGPYRKLDSDLSSSVEVLYEPSHRDGDRKLIESDVVEIERGLEELDNSPFNTSSVNDTTAAEDPSTKSLVHHKVQTSYSAHQIPLHNEATHQFKYPIYSIEQKRFFTLVLNIGQYIGYISADSHRRAYILPITVTFPSTFVTTPEEALFYEEWEPNHNLYKIGFVSSIMSLSSRNQRLKRPTSIPYLLQGTYEAFKQYNDSMIDRRRAVRVAVDQNFEPNPAYEFGVLSSEALLVSVCFFNGWEVPETEDQLRELIMSKISAGVPMLYTLEDGSNGLSFYESMFSHTHVFNIFRGALENEGELAVFIDDLVLAQNLEAQHEKEIKLGKAPDCFENLAAIMTHVNARGQVETSVANMVVKRYPTHNSVEDYIEKLASAKTSEEFKQAKKNIEKIESTSFNYKVFAALHDLKARYGSKALHTLHDLEKKSDQLKTMFDIIIEAKPQVPEPESESELEPEPSKQAKRIPKSKKKNAGKGKTKRGKTFKKGSAPQQHSTPASPSSVAESPLELSPPPASFLPASEEEEDDLYSASPVLARAALAPAFPASAVIVPSASVDSVGSEVAEQSATPPPTTSTGPPQDIVLERAAKYSSEHLPFVMDLSHPHPRVGRERSASAHCASSEVSAAEQYETRTFGRGRVSSTGTFAPCAVGFSGPAELARAVSAAKALVEGGEEVVLEPGFWCSFCGGVGELRRATPHPKTGGIFCSRCGVGAGPPPLYCSQDCLLAAARWHAQYYSHRY